MESGDSGGSGDGAMAGGDPGFGDSIGGDLSLPSLVDEEPVYTASSSSSGSGNGSSNGSSEGVAAHQAVARVAPAEKTHHQTRPMDKSHLTQVPMQVRQAARAPKVV